MHAIILVRVSTKEQEEGHSLNAQKMRLLDYCERRSMKVLKIFEIIESSTRGDRKEFRAMLEYAKQQSGTIALVADAVDRVQRSFKDSVYLDELIRRGTIELHFYREGRVIGQNASAMDIMCWDFAVMGAKSYVLQLSENVKRSIEWKLKHGEFPSLAPLGYLNVRDDQGKATIIIDPERAKIIRRIFETYATGMFSLESMVRYANDNGLRNKTKRQSKLSKSHLHHLLQNPFYYGMMVVGGKAYPHRYEPLISKELFDQCNDARTRYGERPVKLTKYQSPFRGLMRCAVTGVVITPEEKTKKLKNGRTITYRYLGAPNPENPKHKLYVREEVILDQIREVIASVHLPDAVHREVLAYLQESSYAEREYHGQAVTLLESEAKDIRTKLDRLLDLLLTQYITTDEHERKKRQLVERQIEITESIKKHQEADTSFRNTITSMLTLANRGLGQFDVGNYEQKRQIMNQLFSNLSLRGKNLEFTLVEPMDKFVNLTTCQEWCPGLDSNQHASRR